MDNIIFDKQQKEEALQLLKEIIDHSTINPPGEEKALAEFVAAYLKDTVDTVFVTDLDENRSNVVAIIKGEKNKKKLILNGHLDTVPYGNAEAWNYFPHKATVDGQRIYGRGASDMKSGLAAALYAFKQFSCCNRRPGGDIIFIGTADEESSGKGAYEILESGILDNVGAIIIGEPTNNTIALASKGAIWIEFEIFGKTAHGAYPWEGINAIEIGYRMVDSIKDFYSGYSHKYLTDPTCTITGICGGVRNNMVPDYCKIMVDIRTLPIIDHNSIIKHIDDKIKEMEENNYGLRINRNILNNRCGVETDEQDATVQLLANIVKDVTGSAPCFSGTGFFSDASIFILKKHIPTILFGPGSDSNAHKPNEFVDINNFYTSLQCYKKLIHKY